MLKLTYRQFCYLLALFPLIALGIAFYLEKFHGLIPCSLCMLQRIVYGLIILILVIAATHNPKHYGKYIYSFVILLSSAMGMILAGRQVQLEHIPAAARPACTPGLEFLLNNYPLTKVLSSILTGSGECGEITWQFLNLSFAAWSLLAFALLASLGVVSSFLKTARKGG